MKSVERPDCWRLSKGNQVNIPEPKRRVNGNVYKSQDIDVIPGKSYLFLLTGVECLESTQSARSINIG